MVRINLTGKAKTSMAQEGVEGEQGGFCTSKWYTENKRRTIQISRESKHTEKEGEEWKDGEREGGKERENTQNQRKERRQKWAFQGSK